MRERAESSPKDALDDDARDLEPVLMAVWRRLLVDGCGPDLTVAEAAAVLGISVQSVRRRLAAGMLTSYRDEQGRVRIVPRVAGGAGGTIPEETATRLIAELRDTKRQLRDAQRQKASLERELNGKEQALQHTQEDLAAMWRLMAARSSEERPASKRTQLNRDDVAKIQHQISAVRSLARRRKWPWAIVA
jgi:excisionase family DNA binding protein